MKATTSSVDRRAVAKKIDAAFRMSLARRSSRFSRSSSAMRTASALVVPARRPGLTSAWFTHWRRDSVPMPSCLAMRVTAPCFSPVSAWTSSTIRTARWRSTSKV